MPIGSTDYPKDEVCSFKAYVGRLPPCLLACPLYSWWRLHLDITLGIHHITEYCARPAPVHREETQWVLSVPRIWDPGGQCSWYLGQVVIEVDGNWKLDHKKIKGLEFGT